jgi:hypothetical protein
MDPDRRGRVDPFTPPMPQKVKMSQAGKCAESLGKG